MIAGGYECIIIHTAKFLYILYSLHLRWMSLLLSAHLYRDTHLSILKKTSHDSITDNVRLMIKKEKTETESYSSEFTIDIPIFATPLSMCSRIAWLSVIICTPLSSGNLLATFTST